ncbi:DUF4435 domain-containing protein [Aliarcobacter cryaerophilus]|uniref:DUF4435 domain-containing protein n=1 Tax=Aliarcobacter cryaerophilus TaxID=28198 RepID=UPI0021B559A9|nr:DUF4435 domain-containing protein [Aliarcobacter cryaerophilus]MCT7510435.1 DUF4435 domain-containing protein [Aliarcobacter cryaerophilus]
MSVSLMTPLKMIEATETYHTCYTLFAKKYKKDVGYVYYFHEGEEDPYFYDPIIDTILNKNCISICCNGKDNVIETHSLMMKKREHKNTKCLYFIDKDYSSNTGVNKEIYVTPYYSIENFYVTNNVIKKILEIDFKMDPNDVSKVIKIYKKLQTEFNKKLTFFNSWLACQNDYRETNKTNTKLNIDKKANKYFKIDEITKEDIISKKFELKKFDELNDIINIKSLYPDAPEIDIQIIEDKIDIFKHKRNLHRYFRGKFELKFTKSFLIILKKVVEVDNSLFSKRYSCQLNFTSINILNSLSSRAEKPDCLRTYILSKG